MPSNWAHVHLLLNHIPTLGVVFGLVWLVIAALRRNDAWTRAALWTFVAAALLTIPTYLTGEPGEHFLRDLPGVEFSQIREHIEEHEETALFALIAVEALGLVSLAGLFLSRGSSRILPPWVTVCLVLAIVTTGLLTYTSHLGGHTRHPETQGDLATPPHSG